MKNSKVVKGLSLVCVLSMMLTACGTSKPTDKATGTASKEVTKEAPTKITWIIRFEEQKNAQPVLEKVNAITKEKINMELNMQFISPGDYNDKMQMKMAGGEEYDLCFTSSWANNYVQNAGKGAYLKLDDLIEKNAPDVWNTIPKKYWDGIKINGGIYALMNYQVMYNQPCIFMKKDVADELGIDATKIKSWSDMTNAFKLVKAKKPDIYPTRGGGQFNFSSTLQETPVSLVSDAPYLALDPATKKSLTHFGLEVLHGQSMVLQLHTVILKSRNIMM